jgi:hypothetical protein
MDLPEAKVGTLHFSRFPIEYNMRKKKIIIPTCILVAIFILQMTGGILHAQEETTTTEKVLWTPLLYMDIPPFTELMKLSLILFIRLLPMAAAAAAIKIWMIKRKLSLPNGLGSEEKLVETTLAETVVELLFLILLINYFTPVVSSLLVSVGITVPATAGGNIVRILLHFLFVLPYQCLLGAVFCMLQFNLLTPTETGELRKYFKYGAFLALVLPVLIMIFVSIVKGLLQRSYI